MSTSQARTARQSAGDTRRTARAPAAALPPVLGRYQLHQRLGAGADGGDALMVLETGQPVDAEFRVDVGHDLAHATKPFDVPGTGRFFQDHPAAGRLRA